MTSISQAFRDAVTASPQAWGAFKEAVDNHFRSGANNGAGSMKILNVVLGDDVVGELTFKASKDTYAETIAKSQAESVPSA